MLGLREHHETELLEAASSGDGAQVTQLLHEDVDMVSCNAKSRFCRHHSNTEEGATPLHLAARHGHDDVVNFLLSLKASVAARTENGSTALHNAARGSHRRTAQILLDHGASPTDEDGNGHTPTYYASNHGAPDETLIQMLRPIMPGAEPIVTGRDPDRLDSVCDATSYDDAPGVDTSTAQDVIDNPDVLVLVNVLRDKVELLRHEMSIPITNPVDVTVLNAEPR